ncbi:MAG: hypothetical protein WCR86_07520, partial [Parabacteroides sp.]
MMEQEQILDLISLIINHLSMFPFYDCFRKCQIKAIKNKLHRIYFIFQAFISFKKNISNQTKNNINQIKIDYICTQNVSYEKMPFAVMSDTYNGCLLERRRQRRGDNC